MDDATKSCPACAETIKADAVICRHCRYDFRTSAPGGAAPPPPPPSKKSSWPIILIVGAIGCFLIVPVIAIIAAIAIPGLLAAQRASNERNASACLRVLSTAQSDFRSNDRDGDRVMNYWVRDVWGLYALVPSTNGTDPGDPARIAEMIKLVDPSLAAADASGKEHCRGAVPIERAGLMWQPKATYVFRVFESYETSGAPADYASADAGAIKAYGPAYSLTKYGLAAVPTQAAGGRRIFIVNEDYSLYGGTLSSSFSATYRLGTAPSIDWSGGPIGPADPFPVEPARGGFSRLD
jgi:type II secretory pathway pseudopilin PulG